MRNSYFDISALVISVLRDVKSPEGGEAFERLGQYASAALASAACEMLRRDIPLGATVVANAHSVASVRTGEAPNIGALPSSVPSLGVAWQRHVSVIPLRRDDRSVCQWCGSLTKVVHYVGDSDHPECAACAADSALMVATSDALAQQQKVAADSYSDISALAVTVLRDLKSSEGLEAFERLCEYSSVVLASTACEMLRRDAALAALVVANAHTVAEASEVPDGPPVPTVDSLSWRRVIDPPWHWKPRSQQPASDARPLPASDPPAAASDGEPIRGRLGVPIRVT